MPMPWCRIASRTRLVLKATGKNMLTANQDYAPPIGPLAPAKFTRQFVHYKRAQCTSGVHDCQLVSGRFHWKLRADRCAQWRRHNRRHAGLHVLGIRMPFHKKHLHHAA